MKTVGQLLCALRLLPPTEQIAVATITRSEIEEYVASFIICMLFALCLGIVIAGKFLKVTYAINAVSSKVDSLRVELTLTQAQVDSLMDAHSYCWPKRNR
jgi:H+/gluconate symporter-like permease